VNLTMSEQVAVLKAPIEGNLKRIGLDPLAWPTSN
jgi:hypothetical protein